jgi:hypothetical protein
MKLTTASQTVAVPEPSELAVHYYRSGNVLWAVSTGLSLLIPALLLFTGLSVRLRRLAQRASRRWILMVTLYALLFTLVTAILTLPLAYYEEYVRQHAYGLSNQSLGKWWGEWLKGVAVSGLGLALCCGFPTCCCDEARSGGGCMPALRPSRSLLSSWWLRLSGWTRSSTISAP